MSIKNQKTLFISAFVIIGLSIGGLFALNYTVKKISQISPPQPLSPMVEPRMPNKNQVGTEDVFEKPMPNMKMPPQAHPPGLDERAMQRGRMAPPSMPEQQQPPPRDTMHRVRNGRDNADMRRMQPPMQPPKSPSQPPSTDDIAPNGRKKDQPMQPDMRGFYPPPGMPDPSKMSPSEREMFERELERRREMFKNGPPPGFYPPPGYGEPPRDNNYDGGYDNPEDGYDYDYDSDWEGKNEPKSSNTKTAEIIDSLTNTHDQEEGEDTDDDYLFEYYEE